jgi:hypothetical protein
VMQVCLQRLCSQSQSGVMSQRVDLPRWLTEISPLDSAQPRPRQAPLGIATATVARPNGAGPGPDDFGARASALPTYDGCQSSRRQDREAI